jgi:hypothetical protein
MPLSFFRQAFVFRFYHFFSEYRLAQHYGELLYVRVSSLRIWSGDRKPTLFGGIDVVRASPQNLSSATCFIMETMNNVVETLRDRTDAQI